MDIDNLVRIGTVTDVDTNKRLARVKYRDTGINSDWLYVLTGADPWMPELDATVLCLYLPVFNADGFILGATRTLNDIER